MGVFFFLIKVIALIALFPLVISSKRRVPDTDEQTEQKYDVKEEMISLTDDNFASYLDNDVTDRPILVSFCTTTTQCMEFSTMYRKVAEEIIKNIELDNIKNLTGIVFAYCEISDNPILVQRFGITHMPTIYYRKDGKGYLFKNKNSKIDITNFVLYKYAEEESLSLPVNPFGIIGEAKGLKAFLYMNSRQLLPLAAKATGISPLAVLLSTIVGFSIILLIASFTINYIVI